MVITAYNPPYRVWHKGWELNRETNIGLMVAEFSGDRDDRDDYAWVIPPGALRPLTFKRSELVIV